MKVLAEVIEQNVVLDKHTKETLLFSCLNSLVPFSVVTFLTMSRCVGLFLTN